jgi:hypothetical protein
VRLVSERPRPAPLSTTSAPSPGPCGPRRTPVTRRSTRRSPEYAFPRGVPCTSQDTVNRSFGRNDRLCKGGGMRIGIVGGTGPAGTGSGGPVGRSRGRGGHRVARPVACRVRRGGPHRVVAGDQPRAHRRLQRGGGIGCDLVVVATPWDSAIPTVKPLAAELAGKVVVSMANALVKEGREFLALFPPRGSVAASIQATLPDSLVSASFHHLPAIGDGEAGHAYDRRRAGLLGPRRGHGGDGGPGRPHRRPARHRCREPEPRPRPSRRSPPC